MTDSERFVSALQAGDLEAVRAVPKADLHNHSWLGGRRSYVEARTGCTIPPPPERFHGLDDFHRWTIGVFLAIVRTLPRGRVEALEAAFAQAAEDGVAVLAMSFGVLMRDRAFDGSLQLEIDTLKRLHRAFAPNVELRPVLGLNIALDHEVAVRLLEDHATSGFYEAIDLYGLEGETGTPGLKDLCRRAKAHGLRLTAHAGEFGEADAVMRAVVELELEEVQHGIAAAGSPQVMRFLADNDIRLNVCPASNIRLGRADDYATHPIRTLFDHGVRVTVNTDDVTVFDQGVSEEFLNLYRAGSWAAEELDEIRKHGLIEIA
jgi:adenosine deaminase